MEHEKIDCESKGGTWTDVDGTWKCVHPESSEEMSAAMPTDSAPEDTV